MIETKVLLYSTEIGEKRTANIKYCVDSDSSDGNCAAFEEAFKKFKCVTRLSNLSTVFIK